MAAECNEVYGGSQPAVINNEFLQVPGSLYFPLLLLIRYSMHILIDKHSTPCFIMGINSYFTFEGYPVLSSPYSRRQ